MNVGSVLGIRSRLGRSLVGTGIGAVGGFVTYWLGATLLALPILVQAPARTLPGEMLRPIHTVTAWEIVIVLTGALVGLSVARYRWHEAGVLSYVSLVSVIAGYLFYALTISIPRVPASERWLSYVLLAAEGAGLGLIVVFSFYSLDAATRGRWTRVAEQRPFDPLLEPEVALVVPVYNEPLEVVRQTVAHLVRQAYPGDRYHVIVADDSTDAGDRERLAEVCKRLGAHHVTREDRTGFKAGAINHVVGRLPERVELVGVVDADYWVEPDYLSSVVGYFTDPDLGFVQTPQDYRNEGESFLTRQYKRAEAYFYHAVMPSRNEENAIIFCGTMGMLRRSALEDVGGFGEDQVCEDAEISVRLAVNGWESLYIDESYGEGLMPPVFEAYKKQFHRWAFGNVKILFTHTRMILRSDMTPRQKLDFIVSNLHWFDGFFVLAIALVLLYLGSSSILGLGAVTYHQRELILLALVPIALLGDAVARLHLVLRKTGATRWRDAFLVQGMWFSIKLTNVVAVTKAMLGFDTPFIRTPKSHGGRLGRLHALLRSIRLTKIETVLGATLLSVAAADAWHLSPTLEGLGASLLPLWLVVYATFFLCAPLYAYLSYRTRSPMTHEGVPLPDAPDAEPTRWASFEVVDQRTGS